MLNILANAYEYNTPVVEANVNLLQEVDLHGNHRGPVTMVIVPEGALAQVQVANE